MNCELATKGPSTAWLALTEACNNKCTWCYENENSYLTNARSVASATQISLDEMKTVLPVLVQTGLQRVILIGGEPTLNSNLFSIISYVAGLGLQSNIVTNARRAAVHDYAIDLRKAGLAEATVSMHGWSPESYEGKGSASHFGQALKGMRNLKDAGVSVGVTMVLGAHTLNHADAIVAFLNNENIRTVQFNIAAPAVSPTGVDGSATAPMKLMARHVVDLFTECTYAGITASFQLNLPFCLFSDSEIEVLLSANAIKQSCHVVHGGGIVVRPGFKMAVCTHLMEFEVNDGSGKEIFATPEAFIEFWRSSELEAERDQASAYRRPQCESCDAWTQCGGGCMVHWSFFDPFDFEVRPITRNLKTEKVL